MHRPSEDEAEVHENVELVVFDRDSSSSPTSDKITKTDLFKDAFLIGIIVLFIFLWVLLGKFQQPSVHKPGIVTSVPTIGIMSKPLVDEHYDVVTNKTQVIEAKYVRYIEGGGGKPIFINYNSSESELRQIFQQINGLILIGGAVELNEFDPALGKSRLTPYGQKAKFMVDLAKDAFNRGEYFPIWGTCLGYEALLLSIGEDYDLLKSGCNCFKYNDVLRFTPEANESRLYSTGFGPQQREWFTTLPMTYNSHNYFVTVEDFNKNPKLVEELRILSTSTSKNGTVEFISSVEGKRYPFYGVQFHPEKSVYDYNPTHPTVHSPEAIQNMQSYAVFFVNEARKNAHHFADPEEEIARMVYNVGEMAFESRLGPVYLFP